MSFQSVSIVSAGLFFTLFLCLLGVPEFVLMLLGVETHTAAEFISRRAALLFLGISILFFLGRTAPHSISRQAILMGMSCSMLALALLGSVEFIRGYAGPGIWGAVITEILLVLAYLRLWKENRGN